MPPQIHLIDETWIDAPVDITAAAVANPAMWRRWWPTLHLTVTRDRGVKGIQWVARSTTDEPLARTGMGVRQQPELFGTVELWLEPAFGGVLLHHFLRLDPAGAELSRRAAAATTKRFAWHAKQVFWQLKDDLELQAAQPGGVER